MILAKVDRQTLLDHMPFTLALLYYILSIVFIGTRGEFPLNDDYVYSLSVKTFLETGKLNFYSSSSSCILHILSGAFFCQIFGFSIELLRWISLAWGFASLVVFYLLLKELDVDKNIAGIAVFLAAVNPVLVNLRFTFMTDTASLSLILVHQLLFVKGLKQHSNAYYALSGLFLVLAILVRQTCIMWVTVNFLILVLLTFKRKFSTTFLIALILMPLAVAIAGDRVLETHSTMLDAYHSHKARFSAIAGLTLSDPIIVGKYLFIRSGQLLSYLAIFCLPLLLVFCHSKQILKKMFARISIWHALALVSCAAVIYAVQVFHEFMPFCRNIWHVSSLGSYTLIGQIEPLKDKFVRCCLSYAAVSVSLIFIAPAVYAWQKSISILRNQITQTNNDNTEENFSRLYLVLIFAAGFAFTVIHLLMRTYDRYIMDLVFPTLTVIALSAVWLKVRVKMFPVLCLVLLFGLVSSSQQQAYMSWNRARWQAIDKLASLGIERKNIEGGAEYAFDTDINIWHKFKIDNVKGHSAPESQRGNPPYNKLRWWPVHGDEYTLSFVPLSGYSKIDSQPFSSFYPFHSNEIQILKRNKNADQTASLENSAL